MADGADEGRFAAVGCPRDPLRIEDPEIFPAAAAPRHDDLIDSAALVEPVDGRGDLIRRLKALHVDRAEQQLHSRPTPPDDIADILQCGTGLAGDKADAPGKLRQRLLMFRREQTLLVELCFQLLKGKLRRTDAIREHVVDIDLKRTVPLVEGDPAAHDDLHSLFGAEPQPPRVGAEHDGFHAGGLIP